MGNNLQISIVTINYNNYSGLKSTIESVLNQTYSNIQYIIIDGNSTDNSIDLIKGYSSKLYKWISEKDNGIYHAMNKGIKLSTGDYVLLLNSGDILFNSSSISDAVKYIKPGMEIVACDLFYSNEGKLFKKYNPNIVSVSYFTSHVLYHPSLLISSEVYRKYGLYNENLKIVSDWEFTLKTAGIANCSYQHIPVFLSVFDMSGVSSKYDNNHLQYNERRTALASLINEKVFDELAVLQMLLDSKGMSFDEFRNRQLVSYRKFLSYKDIIRNNPNIFLVVRIMFSKISLYHKKYAIKMLFNKLLYTNNRR